MPKTQPKVLHVIDRNDLRLKMWENRITQDEVVRKIKPRVTRKAISKALLHGSRFLLPKIESAITQILKERHK